MRRPARRIRSLCTLLTLGLLLTPSAQAYELDLHFHSVYALLRLAGIAHDDALLVARASYSVDVNAENSPFPEPLRGDKTHYWTWRAKQWHCLPAYGDEEYCSRRMRELYGRALAAQDDRTARIYFGQYLHYVADSWSHPGFHNIFGHLLRWHAPDVPVPDARESTRYVAMALTLEARRFERTRFRRDIPPVSGDTLDAIVSALQYAAPDAGVPIGTRAVTARQKMEEALRARGANFSLPVWVDPTPGDPKSALPFTEDGALKPASQFHAPRDWEQTLAVANRAAAQGVAAALAPLGVQDPQLGGVDLTNVRIQYVTDSPAPNGERALAFGLEPDPSGRGAHARLAIEAFAAALVLPNESWWVNLNPSEPHRIVDPLLGRTDPGRALLEADLLLKTIAQDAVRPGTAAGDAYWREAFKVVPTGTETRTEWRMWIVPGDCDARVTGEEIEITRCLLDVRMNLEAFAVLSPITSAAEATLRQSEIQLRETHVVPVLRRAVNDDPRFAELRAVYYSRALAQAYKQRFGSGGALARLADSLDLKAFPAATRRAPRAIWEDMSARFKSADSELRVVSPYGDRRIILVRSGGVAFDDVPLREASRTGILEIAPPGKGLLVARAPASSRARWSAHLEAAMGAYRQIPVRERGLLAATALLPALAFLKSPEYDTVRREAVQDREAAARVAFADALRTGSTTAAWLDDAMAFAIWSRRNSLQASAMLGSTNVPTTRLFTYGLASMADPRAADSRPGRLLAALVAAAPRNDEERVALLAALAGLSSAILPQATEPIVDQLTAGRLSQDALKRSKASIFTTIGVLSVTNPALASELLEMMNDIYGLVGSRLEPGLVQVERELTQVRARLADAERRGDIRTGDLSIAARLARMHWLTNKAVGAERARLIAVRALESPPSDQRDAVLTSVLPLLAGVEPTLVPEIAALLRRPADRLIVFSRMTTLTVDSWGSDLLLSQQIVEETINWLAR